MASTGLCSIGRIKLIVLVLGDSSGGRGLGVNLQVRVVGIDSRGRGHLRLDDDRRTNGGQFPVGFAGLRLLVVAERNP